MKVATSPLEARKLDGVRTSARSTRDVTELRDVSRTDAAPRIPNEAVSAAADVVALGSGLPAGVDLLERLENICVDQGLSGLARRLDDMVGFVTTDLAAFEIEFASLPRRPQRVGQTASHLLDLGGKRLRPLCLSLAARLGTGFDSKVLDLSVAVELVHAATLLHDDVVDLADSRRGSTTARSVYGNAASIFAGDWLLIEALRRVRGTRIDGLLDDLFDVVEEMIFAESLQLENRGRLSMDRETYFRVVRGKTASVFRWAMRAGGAAGGLDAEHQAVLADYGEHLGITFQAVDDLLDLTGDPDKTGKDLFTDVREGKMTLPLIFALEREPRTRPLVTQVLALGVDDPVPPALTAELVEILERSNAVSDTLELARSHSRQAVEALATVPHGPARRALATVAEAIVDRDV